MPFTPTSNLSPPFPVRSPDSTHNPGDEGSLEKEETSLVSEWERKGSVKREREEESERK
jgi:hypothetical protein